MVNCKIGRCNIFANYFLNYKEYRKMKLEKIMKKIGQEI